MNCSNMNRLYFFLTPLILSGCAVSPEKCDPREGGFISSTVGVLSGCFEERVQESAEKVRQEQELNIELSNENQELRLGTQRKQQQLEAVRRRLGEIEREIPILEQRIAEREESEAVQNQLLLLKEELRRLEELEVSLTESL